VDAKARPASVTEAVASMLVWLYYGASGKCAARRIGAGKVSNALAGPLRSKMSYFPWGDNLFTTLVAAIPYPQDGNEDDLCPWERAELPDPVAVPTPRRGVMGRLTDRAQHAVLLNAVDGEVVDAWITVSTKHAITAGDDPYTIYQNSQAGNRYQRYADSQRALWRDLDTLLTAETTGVNRASQPAVFTTATQLPGVDLRVRALGFQQDGQAKDEQFVSGTTPVVLHLADNRDDSGVAGRIGDLRNAGEVVGARLDRAVKNAWANLVNDKPKECAWAVEAGLAYWPKAEAEFWRRLNDRDFEDTFKGYLRIAAGIFDDITAHLTTLRGIQAVEAARIWLYGGPPRSARR
jgi:CRISPR system Cascade subunit CasA